jgi:tetratricopeptide (TPR) repeat protein
MRSQRWSETDRLTPPTLGHNVTFRGAQMRAIILLGTLLCASLLMAQTADEHQHAAPEQLGQVTFPTSCSPTVQQKFERGVALLHSFAYTDAEQAFRNIAQVDEKCAMAHWGVAMSLYHPLWEPWITDEDLQRGAKELESARSIKATDRERAYIDALNSYYGGDMKRSRQQRALDHEKAMASVAAKYPKDTEAQVFYALALLATATPADRKHRNQKKAADLLEPIYRSHPQHPGPVHYLIHAYDNAELARRGLAFAREYSQVAPDAPHALHMPSHIFTRLGMWNDSVRSNEAARLSAHQHGDLGEELHAMDYLMYAYLQSGRVEDAMRLLRDLDTMKPGVGEFKIEYAAAAMPVRYTIEQERWEDAAALEAMPPQALPQARAIRQWARGIALARLGRIEDAKRELERMQSARDQLEKAGNFYWATQVETQIMEVQALIARAEQKNDEALRLMRTAADEEDAVEKIPITPGPIVPARELLAGLLLEMKRPKEALVEYEAALALSPGRRASLAGAAKAAEMAGDSVKS